ncbi:Bcr/CflA family multidrug efflux MFS transporter [Marinomonas pollencensis]|uniref:Bcr/CflA family efflux transporter n=1 Tax=Marinomonas pollencensis TaxID=491954 RepID=A0A3E0DSF1_9GAMM|nr:Bcr/CflA family multidrug efflux MFS transporter [Marinomonas pollencensis]REG86463.1 DHA1 family bicyclomycin/chloramphenicol resistance-like MFS transporter [Marinomonas pollencensis]
MKLTFPVILVLGLLSGLTPLAIDAYLPSIPSIAKDLNTDIGLVQMTLSMYLIVFAVLQLFFGPISDAIGRRKVVLSGLSLFFLGSIICALAQNYNMLISGRAIQAIGGAAVAVSIPALVKDKMSANQFAKAMSMVMLTMSLAPLAAPIIGGAILVFLNWHYIFVFLAIVSSLGAILFMRTIPETLHKDKRKRLSLINALSNYYTLLKKPAVIGYIGAGSLHFAGMMCFITGSSYVYIELYDIKASQFGFVFALNVLGMVTATFINSRLVEKVGVDRLTKYAVCVLLAASAGLFILSFFDHPPLISIIACCIFFMGTMGILGGGFMAGAMRNAGNHNGSVAALAGSFRFSAGALSGVAVSLFHTGTAAPMLLIMALCGTLAFITYQFVHHKFEPTHNKH